MTNRKADAKTPTGEKKETRELNQFFCVVGGVTIESFFTTQIHCVLQIFIYRYKSLKQILLCNQVTNQCLKQLSNLPLKK